MKVLQLSPWFPFPAFGGALIRVFETLCHLAHRHQVTLLAPVNQPPGADQLRAIADLGVEVATARVSDTSLAALARLGRGLFRGQSLLEGLHYDVGLARELRRLTARRPYDVVHVEHSFMAPYVAWVDSSCRPKTVLSMHNIESLRFRREMRVASWGPRRVALAGDDVLFNSWEERAVLKFDGIVVVSQLEQSWVRQHAPADRVALVPNGVNLEHFRPAVRCSAPRTIVFTGLMNYSPNVDAVVWFCNAVFPLVARRHPGVRFSIVGDKPTRTVQALARRPGVEVTGRVPDVRPYLTDAAVVVVPVRSGAGTRLKILEAMAMERPVVATPVGAEGLEIRPEIDILLGESPAEFAGHVCALLEDGRLRERLGREGRQLVENRYGWERCFGTLDDLYERVTGVHVVHDPPLRPAVAR